MCDKEQAELAVIQYKQLVEAEKLIKKKFRSIAKSVYHSYLNSEVYVKGLLLGTGSQPVSIEDIKLNFFNLESCTITFPLKYIFVRFEFKDILLQEDTDIFLNDLANLYESVAAQDFELIEEEEALCVSVFFKRSNVRPVALNYILWGYMGFTPLNFVRLTAINNLKSNYYFCIEYQVFVKMVNSYKTIKAPKRCLVYIMHSEDYDTYIDLGRYIKEDVDFYIDCFYEEKGDWKEEYIMHVLSVLKEAVLASKRKSVIENKIVWLCHIVYIHNIEAGENVVYGEPLPVSITQSINYLDSNGIKVVLI